MKRSAGFTLIEVMVAMVIALIGSLALGALFIGSMNSDSLSREREAATNLAKRIMEDWVASPTDALPTPDCTPPAAWASTNNAARPNEQSLTCQPTNGLANVSFTVVADKRPVVALLHPNPPGAPAKYQLGPGLRVTAILVDQNNSKHVWAGTDGAGLFESADGGAKWKHVRRLGYVTVNAIAQQTGSNPAVFYLATDSGLWKGIKIGRAWQWQSVTDPALTATRYTAIAFDPANGAIIYAGSDDPLLGGVYKSVDGGATWKLTTMTSAVNALVTAGGVVFAATKNGVYKSANGISWGLIWPAPAGSSVRSIAAVDATTVFASVHASTGDTVYKVATCGGSAWNTVSALTNTIHAVYVDAAGVGYALTSTGVRPISGGTCSGGSPTSISLSPSQTTGILDAGGLRTYALAINASIWYAGTDAGIFKSTDAGVNWTAVGGNPALKPAPPTVSALNENGFGIFPKEKVVTVSWQHKGAAHSVTLTHITRRPYAARVLQ